MQLRTPEQIFKYGVSPSMIKTWLLCKRKWYNQYVRALKSKASPNNVYLRFGLAWDSFVKEYFTGEEVLEVLIERFKLDFPVELDNNKRTQDNGIKLINKYVTIYPRDTEPFKVTELDVKLNVPMPGVKYPLNAILDGYGVYRDGIWVIDYKSTSMLGASYFNQYKLDYQVICYLWGLEQHLDKKVEGFILDVVGTKKVVNRDSFFRDDTTGCLNQSQIDYGMEQFQKVANEMINYVEANWEDVEAFPLSAHSQACRAYFSDCPYLELCQFNDSQIVLDDMVAKLQSKE